MTELLQEFVSESRDLVEQASQSLLALEASPADPTALNDLFRSMHTIKGGAGLFDAPALIRVVHAGEDLLDALREGEIALTPAMVDLLFRALDQVSLWLDEMEQSGGLGDAASADGAALADALRAQMPEDGDADAAGSSEEGDAEDAALDWIGEIPEAVRAGDADAATGDEAPLWAIEYTPEEQCFFGGEDPLLTALEAPGRRWLDLRPRGPWEGAEAFDPFACNLDFRLVARATREALDDHFLYVESFVRMTRLDCEAASGAAQPGDAAAAPDGLNREAPLEAAKTLLALQREAIGAPSAADLWEGRVASCVTVLERVFRRCGLGAQAARIDAAQEAALETGLAVSFEALIDAALEALAQPAAPPGPQPSAGGEDRAAPAPAETPAGAAAPSGGAEPARKQISIKVDQEQVDLLMKRVGELVVAKNALPFLVKRAEEMDGARKLARDLKSQYDAVNRIVDEIQNAVMQIRMVPVSQVFQRYHRLVRDVSRKLDKKIHLQLEGEDTKADKTIVEELAEPLVHLVRNACDHGLEAPAERIEAGKPEQGVITLAARQVEDQVVVEVRDDGRGVDVAKVRRKAADMGLITAAQAESMSDEDAAHLILHPGFSTADKISDLSGRGVGMDVVHTMVKRTGGTVRVRTAPGEGSCVTISLPLSMAVSQVMLCDVGEAIYGVPIEHIIETVRLPVSAVRRLERHEQVVLRGRLVPLMRLRDRFGLQQLERGPNDELSVLVVRSDGGEVGLVVDRVRSETDVIVEPLDEALNGAKLFSGSALLGDGAIVLTLNLREIL
ncbi:MAG: chemotaxis protein CheA [Pseudomonadota bacterium]